MKAVSSSFIQRWEETWHQLQEYHAKHGALNLRRLANELGITHQALGQRIERAKARNLITQDELNRLRPQADPTPKATIEIASIPIPLVNEIDRLSKASGLSRSAFLIRHLTETLSLSPHPENDAPHSPS